jgi:hypothetical protein
MKGSRIVRSIVVLAILLCLAAGTGQAQRTIAEGGAIQASPGTAFTYQGRLNDGGSPANGAYDFWFTLYDDPSTGNQVGPAVTVEDKAVVDGLFSVQLDFGDVFGEALYLAIGVRPGSSTGAHTTLSPRQELTAAPYALYALDVAVHSHWGETWGGLGTGLTLSSVLGRGIVGESSATGYGGVVGIHSGGGPGVEGFSNGGSAIYGYVISGEAGVTGQSAEGGCGVQGKSQYGDGVKGESGSGNGVYGLTNSASGFAGVSGYNAGSGYGVYGRSDAGPGVSGSSGSSADAAVRGYNSSSGPGVQGESSGGSGVYGRSNNSTQAGVYGYHGNSGDGVYGRSGTGAGIHGSSDGAGDGVRGQSTSGDGVQGNSISGYGVSGLSAGNDGVYGSTSDGAHAGVYGYNSVGGYGIYGSTDSTSDYAAVRGYNWGIGPGVSGTSLGGYGVYGSSTASIGVYGSTSDRAQFGVYGYNSNGGSAIYGSSNSISGYAAIWGQNHGSAPGVSGTSADGHAVYGSSDNKSGVYGTTSSSYAGVYGDNHGSGPGVSGTSTGGPGVYGASTTADRAGVHGESSSYHGVEGYSVESHGVYGESDMGSGVYGRSNSDGGAGVYGYNDVGGYGVYGYGSELGYAGYFDGDVHVRGTLSKLGGSFKIDHPLDPQNQYLAHSFVESPDMMNVYNGNVILDENGEAWVALLDWFEALNKDFRYQLTSIGAPGPNLYIATEITNNRFQIAGGTPGTKVSWQVTGIRHDPYAEANRIPVEEPKPAEERGTCLYPKACDQPATDGIDGGERQPGGAE